MSVAVPWLTWLLCWLAGTALILLALAVSPWALHLDLQVMLPAWVALAVFLGVRAARRRLSLKGERFELRWYWGTFGGSAEEFLGYKPGAMGHCFLIRRRDLGSVQMPGIMEEDRRDPDTDRWLCTFLPLLDDTGFDEVARRSEISPEAALHVLTRPLAEATFRGSVHDLALAGAARAVAEQRHTKALPALEALLPRLPVGSTAGIFVFDALRVLGNASTAAALAQHRSCFEPHDLQHFTRAFAVLATHAERPTLERLLRHDDPFVSRQARRGLERLNQVGPLGA